MNEPAPRPCPFCGSSDARTHVETIEWGRVDHTVTCYSCEATGPASRSEAGAIEAWNRCGAGRPDPPLIEVGEGWIDPRDVRVIRPLEPSDTPGCGPRVRVDLANGSTLMIDWPTEDDALAFADRLAAEVNASRRP